MIAKNMKSLSRSDLLEILVELKKENDELKVQLEQAQRELADRRIAIEEAGSLAEAALKLNGVFEAAMAACEQYKENIRLRQEEAAQIPEAPAEIPEAPQTQPVQPQLPADEVDERKWLQEFLGMVSCKKKTKQDGEMQ